MAQEYFYMRLTENFFESDSMVVLESMPSGYLYQNILLKLYTRSLRGNGRLMLNDCIPYSADLLAKLTRHDVKTVENALQTLKALGLIEVLDSGAIYMLDIQNFIGKSSTEGDRKREQRARIEAEKNGVVGLDKCPDKCPTNVGQISDIDITLSLDMSLSNNEPKKKTKKSNHFEPPTVDEVAAHCREKGYHIDPEAFVAYYQTRNWKVGRDKMSDWKAATVTWEKRERKDEKEVSRLDNLL